MKGSKSSPEGSSVVLPCPLCLKSIPAPSKNHTDHLMRSHKLEELAKELTRMVEEQNNEGEQEEEHGMAEEQDELEEVKVEVQEKIIPESPKKRRGRPPKPVGGVISCDVCNKTFASVGNLNKHKVLHQADKPWSCEQCEQSFNQRRDLKNHVMQRHTGERPHVCDLCGKGFVHKHYLTEHMNYHTGDQNYQCFKCGKKYASSSTLNKHVARHKTERQYKCEKCPRAFTVNHDLKAHMKFVHDKAGKDTAAPVFKSGQITAEHLAVPPNYAVIKENSNPDDANNSGLPFYEKPKPVLRMVAPSRIESQDLPQGETGVVAQNLIESHSLYQGVTRSDSLHYESQAMDEETRRNIESQRQIEEWMIAQGVTLPMPENMIQQSSAGTIQLKIPNVTPEIARSNVFEDNLGVPMSSASLLSNLTLFETITQHKQEKTEKARTVNKK